MSYGVATAMGLALGVQRLSNGLEPSWSVGKDLVMACSREEAC